MSARFVGELTSRRPRGSRRTVPPTPCALITGRLGTPCDNTLVHSGSGSPIVAVQHRSLAAARRATAIVYGSTLHYCAHQNRHPCSIREPIVDWEGTATVDYHN